MIAAAVFIIGEMAGSGILTLPSAIARESKYDFWFTIQKKSFSLVILVVLGNALQWRILRLNSVLLNQSSNFELQVFFEIKSSQAADLAPSDECIKYPGILLA